MNLKETFSNSVFLKTLLSMFSKLFLFSSKNCSKEETSREDIILNI